MDASQQAAEQMLYESGLRLGEAHAEIAQLKAELAKASAGNGRVIYALDRAVQLIEVLIAFLPEGQPTHPGLETARAVFEQALRDIRG